MTKRPKENNLTTEMMTDKDTWASKLLELYPLNVKESDTNQPPTANIDEIQAEACDM